MRIINEQELKDILDKHGKWLRNEEFGERADLRSADLSAADLLSYADLRSADLRSADLGYADLRSANLRYADLRSANLSYADLRSADLRSANLSYANLSSANLRATNLMIFQFNRHQAFFTMDGTLRIGCKLMSISDWSTMYEEIGRANQYSELEMSTYGGFIKTCLEIFKKANP